MTPADTLPPDIRQYLAGFAARRRRLSLLKAGGSAIAFALSWILAWCVIDRLAALPTWIRVAILCAGAFGTIIIVAWPLWLIARRRKDWVDAAEAVERQSPVFSERLETITSQLLSHPHYRGSPALLAHLQSEVAAEVSRDPREEARRLIPARLVVRPWMVAGALLLVIACLLPIRWLNLPMLMGRLARPWAAIAPVTTTLLTVTPGDQDIPQGQTLEIHVTAKRLGDGLVSLYMSDGDAVWSRLAMTPLGEGRFDFKLAGVTRDARYYVTGGDAKSPVYQVRVQRTPGISSFRIRYTYPEYMGRPPLVVTNTDGLVEAPVKSQALIAVTSTEPLSSATLIVGGAQLPMTKTVDPFVRQATVTVSRDEPYSISLLSDRQVGGDGPGTTMIHALPDRSPMVRVFQPAEDLRLHPRDLLAIQYEALDDYGIGTLTLHVRVNAKALDDRPLKVRGDPRRQLGQTILDLATLDVKIGDLIAFRISGTDRAGQTTASEERHVLVSPRSIDLNTHLRIAELKEAVHLAHVLANHIDSADHARSADAALNSFQIDQDVAGASETGALLRQRLLRADVRADSDAFSQCIAVMIDQAQIVSNIIDDISRVLGGNRDSTVVANRIPLARQRIKTLIEELTTLSTAAQASAILADRNNLVASQSIKPPDKAAAERQQLALKRVREDIAQAATAIGLDANSGALDAQLKERIRSGEALMKRRNEVDFVGAARQWAARVGQPPDWRDGFAGRLTVGAQAEAVRPEGDLVRARDLQLSARAAERLGAMGMTPGVTTQPALAEPLKQYPSALDALRREWALNQHVATGQPSPEAMGVHTDAADARKKMMMWAGENEIASADDSSSRTPEETALEASAAAQQGDFDRAQELDNKLTAQVDANTPQSVSEDQVFADAHRTPAPMPANPGNQPAASTPGQPASNPPKPNPKTSAGPKQTSERMKMEAEAQRRRREQVRQAMAAARQIDEIVRRQEQVSADTRRSDAEQLEKLADRQQQIAEAIEKVRRPEVDDALMDDPADGGHSADEATSRETAMRAMQQAQERLAVMPHELAEAQQAVKSQVKAAQLADQATRSAASASPEDRPAAERAAAQAKSDLADAAGRTAQAAAPVSPNVSEGLSVQLGNYAPETTPVVKALDEHLTPALREMEQAIGAKDAGGVDRAAAAARKAIDLVQKELHDAQERINERDPILAAKWFAQAAAEELRRRPPDVSAAQREQQRVSQSLVRAQGQALHTANEGRMAQTPMLGSLYRMYDVGVGGVGDSAREIIKNMPGLRDWGLFREQSPADLNASLRESDPPGYRDALKAYFEALGRQDKSGTKAGK